MAPIVRNQGDRPQTNHTSDAATEESSDSPWALKTCVFCKKRRIKCDRVRPRCGTCTRLGHECGWSTQDDGRRPATKQYVESLRLDNKMLNDQNQSLRRDVDHLRERLTVIERYLEDVTGEDVNLLVPPTTVSAQATSSTAAAAPSAAPQNDPRPFELENLTLLTQNLKIDDNGELSGVFGSSPWVFQGNKSLQLQQTEPLLAQNSSLGQHILCFDDSIDTTEVPCIDWNRHLPPEVPLSRCEHDRMLNRVWLFFTSWCMRMNPSLFLRDMCTALAIPAANPAPRTAHYSAFLHNALLSVATALSDFEFYRDKRVRQLFADKAKSYLDQECSAPTLSAKQALFILGSYHSGNGEHRLGYLYFGMGIRVARYLGLSLDCSGSVKSGQISLETQQDRLWSFWTSFAQDKCWSIYIGNSHSVPLAGLPDPPVNTALDETLWTWNNSMPQPTLLSLTFLETCKALRIAARIMDAYGSRGSLEEVQRTLVGIQVDLDRWYAELPSALQINRPDNSRAAPHIISLNLAYPWLTIILNRPFYRRSAQWLESVKRCNSAAERCVTLLGLWDRLYGLRFTPITPIQMAFTAGTTYLLAATQKPGAGRLMSQKKALQGVRDIIRYLKEMEKTWVCAEQTREMLEELLRTHCSVPSSPVLPPTPAPTLPTGSWDPAIFPDFIMQSPEPMTLSTASTSSLRWFPFEEPSTFISEAYDIQNDLSYNVNPSSSIFAGSHSW